MKPLTEEETISLGNFCEELMLNEHFNFLAERFKQEQFEEFLASKPIEKREREAIYEGIKGFDTFCAQMISIISKRNELHEEQMKQQHAPSSDDDALED